MPFRNLSARGWLLVFLGWSLFGLFNGTQTYLTRIALMNVQWRPLYTFALLDAMIWMCLTPLMLQSATLLSPSRIRWKWALAAQVAVGVVFAFLHFIVFVNILPYVGYYRRGPRSLFVTLLPTAFQADLLTFWVFTGGAQAVEYYHRFRERELKASQLEASLAQARLQVLQMQLQPHFLFNAMNSVSSLMYRDVAAADRVLTRLAGFLRLTLEKAQSSEVSLETELEFTDHYIDIEKARFRDRLSIEKVADRDALDACVPTLILQPLVENAIRHGVAALAKGGAIWIRARRAEERLILEVEDDGDPPLTVHEGIGLRNTRSRLAELYGADQRFVAAAGERGGFHVTMEIPYRVAQKV